MWELTQDFEISTEHMTPHKPILTLDWNLEYKSISRQGPAPAREETRDWEVVRTEEKGSKAPPLMSETGMNSNETDFKREQNA